MTGSVSHAPEAQIVKVTDKVLDSVAATFDIEALLQVTTRLNSAALMCLIGKDPEGFDETSGKIYSKFIAGKIDRVLVICEFGEFTLEREEGELPKVVDCEIVSPS